MTIQRDDAQLWRAEVFGGSELELLRAHFTEFAFSPHAHEEFMIVVTEAGAGSPRFWGGEQRLGPGEMFVLNPGEVHGGGPAEGSIWQYRSFYVPAALMRRAAQELSGSDDGVPQFAEEVFSDPYVTTMLREAHIALEGLASNLERESRLTEALGILVARHAKDRPAVHNIGREHRAVQRAREYLEALPAENVSLERLGQEAGLSPFYLCRVFRRETGLSPHSYQILMRLRLAKTLLADSVPIAEVALESGFYDQAHLTRHFKRVYGVTPGRYTQ